MKYHVLAVDYDGTLAENGRVEAATVDALVRLRQSGRRVVLVSGRLLKQLQQIFPELGICDLVVAENGALLYNPDTGEETPIADPPPREFVEKLTERGVTVGDVGRVIVATQVPFETLTLETIRDLGLELQIIFNKGAVMVLPTGVNKASGLRFALEELGLSPHNAVAIGDAENDEAMLKLCEASAAVSNALDSIKNRADFVASGAAGAGVIELIERLLADDLKEFHGKPSQGFVLGTALGGEEISVPVYGTRMLVTGDSAGGKSKLAVDILDQLIKCEYQSCIIDPEGDFQTIERAIVLGTMEQTASADEVMNVIRRPDQSCVVSLFATKAEDQPEAFSVFLRALQQHRVRTGRPHWHIVDEAHYPISPSWKPIDELHLEDWRSVMYITAFIDKLPQSVLANIDLFVALAENPVEYLTKFCELIDVPAPPAVAQATSQEDRPALAWWRGRGEPFYFHRRPSTGEHQRHRHQNLDGEMDEPDRFRFRGPAGKLNLPAGNLRAFMELADGVDDETWLFHLRRGDYARWFRDKVHDEELAVIADHLQVAGDVSPQSSRRRINEMIQKIYVKQL